MAEERVPETIGRYQIRRELGRGMMGVVYEAHDPSLHRHVALKVVRLLFAITDADKEGFERRFLSEAQIAARLSHPGIVVVHDVGRDPQTGILYIALERLQGRTLAEMTAQGERLPWRQALEITVQVAQALAYAHGQGIVHRDIKPANVMVLPTGEAKIMDFGLAKHEAGHDLTGAGQFVGTPLFMAPEQVTGQKVDGRTDLFSLGSVLYTLLTGARAFAADSVLRIMSRVAHQDPRPATELCPELPPALDDVLARAMAKDPEQRYPTCQELAEDLQDVLGGRPPRHLAGWTRPSPPEGTMVSAREMPPDVERAPAPAPEPAPAPAPRRRRGLRPLRTLFLVVLLAGLSAIYFRSPLPERLADTMGPLLVPVLDRLRPPASPAPPAAASPRRRPSEAPALEPVPLDDPLARLSVAPPSPPQAAEGAYRPRVPAREAPLPAEGTGAAASAEQPARAPAAPPTPSTTAAGPAATPAPQPAGATPAPQPAGATPAPPPAGATPSPRPASPRPATPRPAPPRAAAPRAAKPTPAPPPASLTVRMEHHLKSGTVKVWLDDRLVVDEELDAQVTKKLVFVPVRKGVVEEQLTVRPGRRVLRVQVKWDDNVETKRIVGTFRAGATRQLDVRVSRLGGGLSLEWK